MEAIATEHGLSALRTLGARPPLTGSGHALRDDELQALHGGRWFSELPEALRHAIIGRARVQRVAAGARISQRGDAGGHWVGVARGAVRLGTALSDGRVFTLDFMAPGQWFGDIALVDLRAEDLDMVAHVPSTLLIVGSVTINNITLLGDATIFDRPTVLSLGADGASGGITNGVQNNNFGAGDDLYRQF